MGVTAPTMSSMVETLVQAKLVQRESSETDRRQVILGLTKKGDALFGRVASSVQNKLLERLVSLSSEHKKKLDEGLVILKRIFQ
jgi:DNA-binding MarR family transcriptional regulator